VKFLHEGVAEEIPFLRNKSLNNIQNSFTNVLFEQENKESSAFNKTENTEIKLKANTKPENRRYFIKMPLFEIT